MHTGANVMNKAQSVMIDGTTSKMKVPHIRKRNKYKMYLDGMDVTPKNLVLNSTQADIAIASKLTLENESKHFETFLLQSLLSFRSRLQVQIRSDFSKTILSTLPSSVKTEYDSKFCRFTNSIEGTESKFDLLEDSCPSEVEMVAEARIILKETDTITFFDLPTHCGVQGTPQYKQVLRENDFVDYKITGKGRLVKRVESYVQSVDYLNKTRSVLTDPINFENRLVLASAQDIYDTMNLGTIDMVANTIGKKILQEEDFPDLCNSLHFKNKVQIMGRILASGIYTTEHMIYKCSLPSDILITKVSYSATLLLTLFYDEVKNLSVTTIDINSKDENLFAVGYGNFYHQRISRGCVGIWNIKNPCIPERTYQFENSVSVVRFSKKWPILLAVAFFTGLIEIINIQNHSKIVYFDNRCQKVSYEPVATLLWVYNQDVLGRSTENEYLLTMHRNGYVLKYTFDDRITNCQTLRRVMRFSVELVRGVTSIHNIQFKSNGLTLSSYCTLTSGQVDPSNSNNYYVTTESGALLKCSHYYKNQNLDGFWVHFGPVYCMRFSPFCNSVFLTCGADSTTRLWVVGIYQPVVTLDVPLQVVQDAVWSTTHVTIIASASGSQVQVWDIARKIHAPCIVLNSLNKSPITLVRFINNGQNLLTGDVDGNICIYTLTNLPFRAFRPVSVLFAAIRKALKSNPKLLKKLNEKYGHIDD